MTRHQYGALSVDAARYPLVAVTSHDWDPNLPSVLVTGGVHGYETSGVQGAILFCQTKMVKSVRGADMSPMNRGGAAT